MTAPAPLTLYTGPLSMLLAWRARMTQRPAVRQVAGAMAAWLHSQSRPVPAFLRGAMTPSA